LKPRRREDVGRLLGQMYTRALIHFVNAWRFLRRSYLMKC
jgi:hypothetical protein